MTKKQPRDIEQVSVHYFCISAEGSLAITVWMISCVPYFGFDSSIYHRFFSRLFPRLCDRQNTAIWMIAP